MTELCSVLSKLTAKIFIPLTSLVSESCGVLVMFSRCPLCCLPPVTSWPSWLWASTLLSLWTVATRRRWSYLYPFLVTLGSCHSLFQGGLYFTPLLCVRGMKTEFGAYFVFLNLYLFRKVLVSANPLFKDTSITQLKVYTWKLPSTMTSYLRPLNSSTGVIGIGYRSQQGKQFPSLSPHINRAGLITISPL